MHAMTKTESQLSREIQGGVPARYERSARNSGGYELRTTLAVDRSRDTQARHERSARDSGGYELWTTLAVDRSGDTPA